MPDWLFKEKPVRKLLRLVSWALIFAAFRGQLSAQDLYVLALQRPGQASVAIDRSSSTAYVIDLGHAGDGDQILLGNRTLLEHLEAESIKNLIFICSHPHSDHMGGIRALFASPRTFYKDEALTTPRFQSVRLVENEIKEKESLASILKGSLPPGRAEIVERVSAATQNALAGLSQPGQDVFVQTIPYQPSGNAGVHGRSVVTLMVLGGRHTILDPDDADTSTLLQVAEYLNDKNIKIDTFIVPHHGSAYHDIEPLLSLGAKRAIITVNPRNQYKHPAPEILWSLMDALEPENVYFTGSATSTARKPGSAEAPHQSPVAHIKLGPEGVLQKTYTAANELSYSLFVHPSRQRKAQLGTLSQEEAELYEKVRARMTESTVVSRVETDEVAQALAKQRIKDVGTINSSGLDLGYVPAGGTEAAPGGVGQHIFEPERPAEAAVVYATNSPGEDSRLAGEGLREVIDRARINLGTSVSNLSVLEVRFETNAGLENGLEPPVRLPEPELKSVKESKAPAPAPGGGLPEGGMVYLEGGRLRLVGASRDLSTARLTACEGATGSLCMYLPSGSVLTLPFKLDPLFADVWQRVYEDRISSFYLSINPTNGLLADVEAGIDAAPTDKLRHGLEPVTDGQLVNEVVTSGDIDGSQIGRILWEADVMFKSRSLGYDVLRGRSKNQTSLVRLSSGGDSLSSQDFATTRDERWCRLYWSSGNQDVVIDEKARRVRLVGDAVVANAEAMELRNGELVSSTGGWCRDAKAVARQLQREANAVHPSSRTLSELRKLAEMQSFVRWVNDHGIPVDSELRAKIADVAVPDNFQVPKWTSGIRSGGDVLVQEERVERNGNNKFVVHVSIADSETFDKCVEPAWKLQETDFPNAGYTLDAKKETWSKDGVSLEDSRFLGRWMTAFAKNIANCSSGTVLPMNDLLPLGPETAGEVKSLFGFEVHLQPVHYHGGVFLGGFESSERIKEAWQKKGILFGPDGQLLYRQNGDDLHFWGRLLTEEGSPKAMQHVVVHGGHVVNAYANEGRLRFLIETSADAVVRTELRANVAAGFPNGAEWISSSYAPDNTRILNLAAWPCESVARGDCVRASTLDESEMRKALGQDAELLSTAEAVWVEPDTWVVDLDIQSVRTELEKRGARLSESDTAGAMSLAQAFASWGFRQAAEERSEAVIKKITNEAHDVVLQSAILHNYIADLMVMRRVLSELEDMRSSLSSGELAVADAHQKLLSLAADVEHTAPPVAAPLWMGLQELVEEMKSKAGAEGGAHVQLAESAARFESQVKRTAVLLLGREAVENPVLAGDDDDDSISETMGNAGSVQSGSLHDGESTRLKLQLKSDTQYLIGAACDDGCTNIDLAAYGSSGDLLEEDTLADNAPLISVMTDGSGEIDLEVRMKKCESSTCGFQVSARPLDGLLLRGLIAGLLAQSKMDDLPSDSTDEPTFEGELDEEGQESFEIEFKQGKSYTLSGTCDSDCSSLALSLFDSAGAVLSTTANQAASSTPYLVISPTQGGVYRLEVGMLQCEVSPCAFSVEVTEESSPD
jgi:beta-lactamase superfamily II metal-dependent hydrolase